MVGYLYQGMPFVGAGLIAYIVWRLSKLSIQRFLGAEKRIAAFTGFDREEDEVPLGSRSHRIRMAFSQYGIDVNGSEGGALWLARIIAGGLVYLLMRLVGLPLLASLTGFITGPLIVNGMIARVWTKMRIQVEGEIPTFLHNLASTLQVESNVLQALESVTNALNPEGALNAWLGRLLKCMHARGKPGIKESLDEAQLISPSLFISVFLIGRLWETGGEGYARSFATAAETLKGVLNARVLARSKGEGAKGAVRIVILTTITVAALLLRNPQMAATMRLPIVQVGYALIALLIVFGWSQINQMVEEII